MIEALTKQIPQTPQIQPRAELAATVLAPRPVKSTEPRSSNDSVAFSNQAQEEASAVAESESKDQPELISLPNTDTLSKIFKETSTPTILPTTKDTSPKENKLLLPEELDFLA